jgi:biopolymer transport protein ExbB
MYPLLFCSVAAVTVFLERLWNLRKNRMIPPGFTKRVMEEVSAGALDQARALCDSPGASPMSRIAKAGLLQFGENPQMIRLMVSEVGGQEAVGLEKYLRWLATIAYIAPLLGLLGTVSGMIKAFDTIAVHSMGDPAMLAGGISEALITTAAGLMIAIPVVILHRIVQSRAARISLELDKEAVTLTEHLIKCSQSSTSPVRVS